MTHFTDRRGRHWSIDIDMLTAFRLDAAGIRITGQPDPLIFTDPGKAFFRALFRSPGLQAELLWQLIKPQADEKSITRDDFLQSLSGDIPKVEGGTVDQAGLPVMPLAAQALLQEIEDFFRSSPTSSRRFLRMRRTMVMGCLAETARAVEDQTKQQQVLSILYPDDSSSGEPDGANDSTTSADSPPWPESTGAPPESPCAS